MIVVNKSRFLLAFCKPIHKPHWGVWTGGVHVERLYGGWHVEVFGIVTHWYRKQSQPPTAVETKAMTP